MACLAAEFNWLQSQLSELQVKLTKVPLIWCDNISIISMSTNAVLHARTKHIEIDLYFVRDKLIQKQLEVKHVSS